MQTTPAAPRGLEVFKTVSIDGIFRVCRNQHSWFVHVDKAWEPNHHCPDRPEHKANKSYLLDKNNCTLCCNCFSNNWIIFYELFYVILKSNGKGKQLISKFIAALCTSFGTKLVTSTENYPQRNRQYERYNSKLVSSHRLCFGERQQNWDFLVQALRSVYIAH